MSYKLSVKILVYSRYENVVDYLSNLALRYTQVLFEINDDSGSKNYYPFLDNIVVTYTNRIGHDKSYLQLLGSNQDTEYGYVISDAVILTDEIVMTILSKIEGGKALFILSCNSIPYIDIYWFVTKTGFVVYRTEYLRNLVLELPNFPQLNILQIVARNDTEIVPIPITMMRNKKSYWIRNMYDVWFVDFGNSLEKFMPPELAKIIVKRHAIKNRFFAIPNLLKWGIANSFKAMNFYFLK